MRYGVIGAGALGLIAALRLAQRGHDVTVFERDPVPGGLAGSFEAAPGIWLEKFYHHLFRTDHNARRVIEELGLGARLRWHEPVTTVFLAGRSHPLDTPSAVLKFTPLNFANRLRLAAGVGLLKVMPRPGPLEGQTAGRWMRRVMGDRVFRTVWQPLLRGKFGDAADDISMAWLWARIHCRTAKLGYLQGGFHQVYVALSERVEELGGSIVYGASATEFRRRDTGVEVVYRRGTEDQVATFDRVISTLPTALTVKLTPDMPAEYAARYPAPRAFGAHCLVLALERPLTDVYWIGINEPDMPFLAVVEHTNMVSSAEYGGRHLIYFGNYRPHTDPLFSMTTADVLDAFEAGIRRLNPAFDRTWIRESWSFGVPFAQPIVTPEFARTIPPFETPIEGLYTANMFQVYPYDRGQNYSIALAERLVQHLEGPAAAASRGTTRDSAAEQAA